MKKTSIDLLAQSFGDDMTKIKQFLRDENVDIVVVDEDIELETEEFIKKL